MPDEPSHTPKHTPGPWELFPVGDGIVKLAPAYNGVSILTVAYEGDTTFGAVFKKGDADLIAAAPELLEACEGMVKYFCEDCLHVPDDCSQACSNHSVLPAKAAIAKAKGESHA